MGSSRTRIRVMLVARPSLGAIARRYLEGARGIRIVAETPQVSVAVRLPVRWPPAVILYDHGIAASKALPRLRRAHPHARILVVTSDAGHTRALDVIRRGAQGLISGQALARYLERAIRRVAAGECWLTRADEARCVTALWGLARASRAVGTPELPRARRR